MGAVKLPDCEGYGWLVRGQKKQKGDSAFAPNKSFPTPSTIVNADYTQERSGTS